MNNILTLLFIFSVLQHLDAQNIIIYDPLKNESKGEIIGGQLTSDGYNPGKGFNHILYKLEHPVFQGYITFEIKGMTSELIQSGANHGFLGMYDGRGIEEPAEYWKDFKNNFFRFNFHWRQDRNAIKAVLSCAEPNLERINAIKSVFIDDNRDWTEEHVGDSIDWDPQRWYTVKVSWTMTSFKIHIDKHEVWSVDLKYKYAPKRQRIWLGCAPGYDSKYSSDLDGIIYRNFFLVEY